jgi:hypothetical protein
MIRLINKNELALIKGGMFVNMMVGSLVGGVLAGSYYYKNNTVNSSIEEGAAEVLTGGTIGCCAGILTYIAPFSGSILIAVSIPFVHGKLKKSFLIANQSKNTKDKSS